MSKTTVELLLTRVEVLERAVERLERKVLVLEHFQAVDHDRIAMHAEFLSAMASNRLLARIETSAAE